MRCPIKSYSHVSSCFANSNITFLKSNHCPFRAYANTPQAGLSKGSKSASSQKPRGAKAEASTKASPVPLQSFLPTQTLTSRLNPPASTRPPPLDLPTRAPHDATYKYFFRLSKAYATFYKNGLKTLWTNYRLAQRLPNGIWSKSSAEVHKAVAGGNLSRANFQLIRRTKSDLYRLPPFALLFAICGEFTPLVIIFVTEFVPRIIWIPKQVQAAREKARERRRRCREFSGFNHTAGAMILRDEISQLKGHKQRDAYKYVARSLSLYSEALDKYISFLIPPALIRRRVERRLKELEVDDLAIAREGGVKNMDSQELVMACEDRGMEVLGVDEGWMRKSLGRWLEERLRLSKEG